MDTSEPTPLAQVGEVAWLRVVAVNEIGGFVDWGLPKDLFIPFAEQQQPLRVGSNVLVRVYVDNQGRSAGSTKLDHWLDDTSTEFKRGQEVSLIIADKTELGYKAVIDHHSWGLLYSSELPAPVRKGDQVTGYINRLRSDGKIDLSLVKPGYQRGRIDAVAEDILQKLAEHDGQLLLSDKSSPEVIKSVFGVSKKVFKQAVGALYKQRRIELDDKGMRLLD
ncbi:MAG: S1-like domain-containing RNA-binding protein [Halieaceae bacterium]